MQTLLVLLVCCLAACSDGPKRPAPKKAPAKPARVDPPAPSKRHPSHEHGHGGHPHARHDHHHHPHPHPHLDGESGHHHPY